MEEWKLIPESEGRYSISNLGRVRREAYSFYANKRLISYEEKIVDCQLHNGYRKLAFTLRMKQYRLAVHRLVANAFVENINNKPFVNHKDLDKLNNRADNLEWVTPSENSKHWMAIKGKCIKVFNKPCELTPYPDEEFRKVDGFDLFVSNLGRTYGRYKSYSTFLTQVLALSGYYYIRSLGKGNKYQFFVHKIVATLFVDNPCGYDMVNHIDGNPLNNNSNNLEWCSASMNSKHAFETGLNSSKGESSKMCKHPTENVNLALKMIENKNGYEEIFLATGISKSQIYLIKSGRSRAYCTGISINKLRERDRLTEEEVYSIKEAIFNGADRNHVASMFGTTRRNIATIMRGATWGHIAPQFTIGKTRIHKQLSEETKEKMVRLIKSGVPLSEISKEVGCSFSWVCKIKKSICFV